jgi:quercetin dioxygenase-like cupin family protein
MSNENQITHVPAGTGPVYWGPGDRMRFLITGAETGGALFMAEVSVPPGGGPPPHLHHREDESFYLIEGTLTVQAGDKLMEASSGDLIHLPRGIVHSYRNSGKINARILLSVTPAGLERYFEETFDRATDLTADPPPPSQAMLERFVAAAPRYGLELVLSAAGEHH